MAFESMCELYADYSKAVEWFLIWQRDTDRTYAFRFRMDPNGINVKLGRFALNENNIFSMTTTEFPNGDDPGEFTK